MTKVTGTISQLNVTGSITQLNVTGVITQLSVNGSIVELGVTHTPPVYVSSEVGTGATNELRIEFDINIDAFSVPLVSEFSFDFSGGAVTASSVTIPSDAGINKTVSIILSRSIAEGETGTVTYSGTSIRSEADEEGIAEGFTETVINNIIGSVPVFVSATVEDAAPTKVVLTYDVDLDEASVPATTDFALAGKTISLVEVSGTDVTVTVTVAYAYGDTITINYTAGANPIRGDVGHLDADSLVNAPVTNNVADTSLIPYVNGFDWPDDNADGIGNGWSFLGAGSGSIVTGNGFTGNAQRVNHVTDVVLNTQLRYSTGITAEIGATYRIRGKYRADAISWRIYLRSTSDSFTSNMKVNAGDAIAFEYEVVATAATEIIINFYKFRTLANSYLEIDEIRLHKL